MADSKMMGAADAADALWGAASLKERFGSMSGRELQDYLFKMYQAHTDGWGETNITKIETFLLP